MILSAICSVWKIYERIFIPNSTRKIMWLLINNIHENNSRWLSRRNPRVSRNQGKITPSIAPSRARLDLKAQDLIGPDETLLFIRVSGPFPDLMSNTDLHCIKCLINKHAKSLNIKSRIDPQPLCFVHETSDALFSLP